MGGCVVGGVRQFCYLRYVLDCVGGGGEFRKSNKGQNCGCMEKLEGDIKSYGEQGYTISQVGSVMGWDLLCFIGEGGGETWACGEILGRTQLIKYHDTDQLQLEDRGRLGVKICGIAILNLQKEQALDRNQWGLSLTDSPHENELKRRINEKIK